MAENPGKAAVMTLRLAWLGPWNTRSAIATFGHCVVTELVGRGHDVTVFRSEVGDALDFPVLPAPGAVTPLQEADPTQIARNFDGVIANIGDHFGYHGAIPRVMERVPCLAIFHDGLLANLAAGWAHHHPIGERWLRRMVESLYGTSAWPESTPFWVDTEIIATHRPMLEWLAPLAGGVITHSTTWEPRLRAATSGRVDNLPLAYPDLDVPAPRTIGDRLVVATIGHVNPNKRADQVLSAIAGDAVLRDVCEYRLLGHVEDGELLRLTRLADDLGISRPLFTGHLSSEEMQNMMADVDVISCLRYPLLESGSASLISAMYSARPTLVSHHGTYADLPDGLVLPCAPGREAPDIAAHLRAILNDPAAAQAMGRQARAHALEVRSAARYVDKMLPAVAAAAASAPAITSAHQLGRTLGRFGLPADDPAALRIARNLSDMLAHPPRRSVP
jgi:glycosyltransferase involved in cell wall biosynthesis